MEKLIDRELFELCVAEGSAEQLMKQIKDDRRIDLHHTGLPTDVWSTTVTAALDFLSSKQ